MAKVSLLNLSEYIYDAITSKGSNFTFERLDREDFLKVKNRTKIKSFSENASLDDLMIMMAKLDSGCCLFFWDKEKQHLKKVHDIIMVYADTDPKDASKVIIKDKVFATCDIEIIKGLQTISKVSNSKVYSINKKYSALKDNAQPTLLQNKLEADRNLEWYSKTIDFALNISIELEKFKIDDVQFKILVYLHTCPNGATVHNIMRRLGRANITGLINKMQALNMVAIKDGHVVNIGVYGIMVIERLYAKFP